MATHLPSCSQVESQFDLKTLIIIEVVFFAIAEAARVGSWKKTGAVRAPAALQRGPLAWRDRRVVAVVTLRVGSCGQLQHLQQQRC